MRALLLVVASMLFYFGVHAQENGYLVTMKGETIRGEITISSNSLTKTSTIRVKNGKQKHKFDGDEIKEMKLDGHDYVLTDTRPDKPKKSEKDMHRVAMSDGNCHVYVRTYTKTTQSGYSMNSYNVNVYYLYEGNKFIDFLEKKNFKKLLTKYFANDEKLVRQLKHDRKISLKKLFGVKED